MILNATCIVQLVHIWIVYKIIDGLLLRPVVDYILSEQRIQEGVKRTIERHATLVHERETTKARAWQHLRRTFKEIAPHQVVDENLERESFETVPSKSLSEQEKHDYIRAMVKLLQSKVDHVH
jgi:hypothetical protein